MIYLDFLEIILKLYLLKYDHEHFAFIYISNWFGQTRQNLGGGGS